MSLTKISFSMIDGIGVNVLDYGADRTGVSESTSAFNNALDAVIDAGGGTLYIPRGTYKVNLDWSSRVIAQDYNQIIIQGEGVRSTLLLGVTGASNAVLTIDRGGSGDNYISSNMVFRDMEFATESNVCNGGTPVIHHAVSIKRSAAEFFNVAFSGGSRSAFYGLNCQYTKFIDCVFRCSSIAPSGGYPSAGCWIQSRYVGETAADQIVFERCVVNANQNGIYVQGCQNLRILNSRIQFHFDQGEGGIVVKDYLDGTGSESVKIINCHFEVNYVRDIYMPSQTNRTLVQGCIFGNNIGQWPSKVAVCEQSSVEMAYIANDFRTADGPTLTINGNGGCLTYLANDKPPYSVTNAGSNESGMIFSGTSSLDPGALDMMYTKMNLSAFYARPGLWLDNYALWVDSSGRLRIKNGPPTSDTDGTVVGTQV